MRDLRYNIASVLGAIALVAVGFAALRKANGLRDSWLFSVTLGLLMLAVLLAVHRTEAKRAFWIGFALFGWGYLSLSLIPSIEPRLITSKALAYLYRTNLFGVRPYAMRVILDPDRMRAHNVSSADIREASQASRIIWPEEIVSSRLASRLDGSVLTLESHFNKQEQWENFILLANSEGEILRLKDVAKVEMGQPFSNARVMAGSDENFIRIGHSLFALLAAWLGGVLFRWLGSVSGTPEVLMEGE